MTILPTNSSSTTSSSSKPAGQQPNPKADKIQQLQAKALKETIASLQGRFKNSNAKSINQSSSTNTSVQTAKVVFISSETMQACVAAAKMIKKENEKELEIIKKISEWGKIDLKELPIEAKIFYNIQMGLGAAFKLADKYELVDLKAEIIKFHGGNPQMDVTGSREAMCDAYMSMLKILDQAATVDPINNQNEWKWSRAKLDDCFK